MLEKVKGISWPEKLNITEMEINFKSPYYEGDKLTVYRRLCEKTYEIGIKRKDGTTAVLSKIVF